MACRKSHQPYPPLLGVLSPNKADVDAHPGELVFQRAAIFGIRVGSTSQPALPSTA